MALDSISRLQTPFRDLYMRRLSANFRRPQPAATRAMRGQSHFAREVLNRAQIILIELDYRLDVGGRVVDIGCLNPGAGSGAAGESLTITVDAPAPSLQPTTITANEKDQITIVGDDVYVATTVAPGYGSYQGRRRYAIPPPSGGNN